MANDTQRDDSETNLDDIALAELYANEPTLVLIVERADRAAFTPATVHPNAPRFYPFK